MDCDGAGVVGGGLGPAGEQGGEQPAGRETKGKAGTHGVGLGLPYD